jgi:hypothetical protein
MANIKISDLTAKGANIDSTDLFEISEFNGLIYVSKKITGQEIIDGVSSNITLQTVTDNGNTTDQSISITDGSNLSVINSTYQAVISETSITVENTGTTQYTSLNTDSIVLRTNVNSFDGYIKNDDLTDTGVVLQFPDKVSGDYTIATTDDLTSLDLQAVTDNGNVTNNPIYVGDLSTSYSEIGNGAVGTENVNNGTYAYIGQDGILGLHNGDVESQLKNTDVSAGNSVVLQFPDKVSGDYTIATTDDLTGGYVPYTGATGNVDLGEYELKAGQLTLDVSPTGTAAVGTTRWNNTLGSSETTLKGGSVILKNGVDLVARVVNKVTPNATLTKAAYPVVRVSGAQGGRLAVAYAQANNDNNSADTLGVVIETIATNQEGFIMTVGQIEDINTTGSLQGETWADGNVLYLSSTIPGAITNIKPTGATAHIVIIGYVEYAHVNNGKIYIKIMNGWELDELHNVYINNGTLANNDALIYESSTQLWKNKTIATALGYTPVTNARNLTINGTTANLSADRTFTVTDGNLSTSDITTNDVSTAKHGFAPKAPNDTTKFLRGDATWAAPAVPTLQQVTDQGNTTDQSISITDGSNLSVNGLNTQAIISDSNITIEHNGTGQYTSLNTDSILLRTNINTYDSYIKNDNVNNTNIVLQFPDKPAGSYTIATTAPNVQSVASAATVTPTANDDIVVITAQAAALTLAAPTGSPVQGQALMIRIKDDGTARGITWTSGTGGYRAIGVTLPTTTVISKTTYVGLIYNSTDNRWDAIGVTTEA